MHNEIYYFDDYEKGALYYTPMCIIHKLIW